MTPKSVTGRPRAGFGQTAHVPSNRITTRAKKPAKPAKARAAVQSRRGNRKQ